MTNYDALYLSAAVIHTGPGWDGSGVMEMSVTHVVGADGTSFVVGNT